MLLPQIYTDIQSSSFCTLLARRRPHYNEVKLKRLTKYKINKMRKMYVHERSNQKRAITVAKVIAVRPPEIYKYYVGSGNNSNLVRRVLSTRRNWEQVTDPKQVFLNFKWQQSDRSYQYDNCSNNCLFKHSLNHLEFHSELSDKQKLFRNISSYCDAHKINVFEILPLTFVLNTLDSDFEADQTNFLKFFHLNRPQNSKTGSSPLVLHIKTRSHVNSGQSDRRGTFQSSRHKISDPFIDSDSKYLWILKPTYYNRGNGIHVFNDLHSLESLMNKYISGVSPGSKLNPEQSAATQLILRKSFRIKEQAKHTIQCNSFIIQKYLQRPLLYAGRKFDIRVWVLFTHELKVYFFKQGYLRLFSYAYHVNPNRIDDANVHLTNNAVQKHNTDYGKYELGNQRNFKHLEKVVEQAGGKYTQVIAEIKYAVRLSALSVRKKINRLERQWRFEIFGFDFMLDYLCKPYLIEVNTNPCIEESSPLLTSLLPRMLDDAFCLTLDQIFETHKTDYNYVVDNELNSENLWQFIVDLAKKQFK